MSIDDFEDDELTDSVPRIVPIYADAELRDLGERLAALYATRDAEPTAPIADEIARIRGRMRRGPRLHAGEYLQDGRYRLIDRLQRGSHGDACWKAFDRDTGDLVFVRVFHGEWVGDRAAVEAFVGRGDQLEALAHPSIGRVLDASCSDDGFVYLVTQLFEAGSISAATLDAHDAIQVAVELAQGLGYAHGQGVVHGDLQPSNVMLAADGGARIVGFSVEPVAARDLASLFRAPETTERGYVPAPPGDVYALGMTLLQGLTGGELPFWVLRDPQRLIRSLKVSEAVKAVVQRATDWDLSARYPDTRALLEELLADPELVGALAERARERERYGVAAEHYESLLKIQPNRAVEIRRILGDLYTQMGTYDRAFVHLLAALERTADVEALFDPLRVVASRTGDWGRLAEALWTQARARDAGRRVVLRMELARVNQEELGNPMAAAETWTQVLSDHRTPDQAASALRALQALARARGDWAGFVGYGRELLEYLTASQRPAVEYAIGRVYLENLDDEDQGLAYIDRAEAAGHTAPDLGLRLQGIRARRGQWQRVIHLMVQQAAGQDIAEASPTLLRAGIIASSVHLEEEAFKVYHALLERAPRHVVALRHLARLHHRAHEHEKANKYYDRLWETYRGKDSEEPEASERAADCCAYALILLKRGRTDEATERLDEALRLNANHVPSLELAGPLFLGKGDTARAGLVFDRLLSLFKSVELSPQKIGACIGMGDLAWIQGRLTAAMGWYNRALELDPFSVSGWWGLTKVAIASRGGHPGADRAPWVMAMPKRYTGHEALARLLSGLLSVEAMRIWLGMSPLGRALLDGGDTPMRVACAVVDVMARNELVAPDLFERLGDACPEWVEPVEEVQRLWFGGGAAMFPVARSYGWTRNVLASDFDPLVVRGVLPTELAPPPVAIEGLRTAESWRTLLAGAMPPAPEPFTMIEPAEDEAPVRFEGPIGALVRDGALWLALLQDRAEVTIGSSAAATLRLTDDPLIRERHARLYRQGSRVYLAAQADGRVQIDGEDREVWRLVGGERVTIGETRLQYQAFDDVSRLPPAARIAAMGWFEEAHAGGFSAPPSEEQAPATVARSEPAVAAPVDAAAPPPDPVEAADPGSPLEEPPELTSEDSEPTESTAAPSDGESAAPSGDPALPDSELSTEAEPTEAVERAPVALSPQVEEPVASAEAVDETAAPEPPAADEPTAETPPPAPEAAAPTPDPVEEPPAPAPAPASEAEPDSELDVIPMPAAPSLPPEVPGAFGAGADDYDDEPPSEDEVVESQGTPSPPARVQPRFDFDEALSDVSGPFEPVRPHRVAPSAAATSAAPPDRSPYDDDESEESDESTPPIAPSTPAWLREALLSEEVVDPMTGTDPDATPTLIGAVPAVLVARETPGSRIRHVEPDVFDFTEVQDADDGLARLESEPKVLPRGVTSASAIPAASRTGAPGELPPSSLFMPIHNAVSVPPLPVIPDLGTPGSPPQRGVAPRPPPEALPQGPAPSAPAPAAPPVPESAAPPAPEPTATPGPVAPLRTASVEYMSGPDRGKRVSIGERLTVGQGTQCGMPIPSDSRLSPLHCTVERTAAGFVLLDSGSANGTVVNGQRITEIALTGGEVIMVGRTVLRFQLEDLE